MNPFAWVYTRVLVILMKNCVGEMIFAFAAGSAVTFLFMR